MFHVETMDPKFTHEPDGSAGRFEFRTADYGVYVWFLRLLYRWGGSRAYQITGETWGLTGGNAWTGCQVTLETRHNRSIPKYYTRYFLADKLDNILREAAKQAYLAALYDQCNAKPPRREADPPASLVRLREYINSPRYSSELGRG